MSLLKRNLERFIIDTAGYLLIITAALTGWLPGPGGIPLFIAGLSLLSINNKWAKDLREYVLKHGGKIVQIIFPKHPIAQWAYDLIAIALFGVSAYMGWRHEAIWQVSLAASAFFVATFISLMNRERLATMRRKRKP